MPDDATRTVVAVVVLGVALVVGIVCVTIVSVATDRNVDWETKGLGAVALFVALLGGMSAWWRRRNGG